MTVRAEAVRAPSAARARALETLAAAAAIAVFARTAHAPALGLVLLAGTLLAALTPRRLSLGTNAQLLLGAVALAAGWWLASARADGPPGGSDALHPLLTGTAFAALAAAVPRLALREPWGGRRATAAFSLMAVIAGGGALHGPVYPALAAVWGVTQLAALAALDPGRPGWSALTRRGRAAALAVVGLGGAVAAAIALGLPPLHDLALAGMSRLTGGPRTGFGLHLELGSLRDLLVSDAIVLRVDGPAPPLLRGVVYDRYVAGRWTSAGAAAPNPLLRGGAVPDGPDPRVTEVRAFGEDPARFFGPLDLAAAAAPGAALRADRFGVLYPAGDRRAERIRFVAGPRGVAPVAGPSENDREVPAALRGPLGALAARWGLVGVPPEAALAALRVRFERDFRYSLEFEAEWGRDPVLAFLEDRREGHCEYFAAGAALLLRAAGLPARVVGGYRVTERNPVGGFHVVRASNAHAWVEVWLPPGGWRELDPTPSAWLPAAAGAEAPAFAAALDAVLIWFTEALGAIPAPTVTQWLVFVALPLVVAFVVSRWRNRRRARRAERAFAPGRYADPLPALTRLLAALAARGTVRASSEPLETFAERAAAEPALAAHGPRAAALLSGYAAWRYGPGGDPAGLVRELEGLVASLRSRA